MSLARLLKTCRDELIADFQQYYGIDIFTDIKSFSPLYLGTLANQLPKGSRCSIKINPDCLWSEENWMLRRILYSLDLLRHERAGVSQTPDPIPTPSETQRISDSLESTDYEYIARQLGVENYGV